MWHETHYMYDITGILYDNTLTLWDITILYSWHHTHYIWHHIQPLWQQPLQFMTSHGLYSRYHVQYICHVIYCVWYHIRYMCDSTQCLYLWHHTLHVYDISTLYGITHSVMTTQPLCNFTSTMSDITPSCICVITPTVSILSNPVYGWHQRNYMYDIICTTYDITSTL